MSILSILGAFIAIFLIILLHEYGHFVVARWCGVRVLRFSVGFGRAVWKRQGKDGVEYRLGLFPLGGYVKMLDDSSHDAEGPLPNDAFPRAALWKRFCIVMAGPLINMLFAVVLFAAVGLIGGERVRPVVGHVGLHSAAKRADVMPGDQFLKVAGQSTQTWRDVMIALSVHAGDKKPLFVEMKRGGRQLRLSLSLAQLRLKKRTDNALSLLGIAPYFPKVLPIVDHVLLDSPANKAGLQTGDHILSFDGKPVLDWKLFVMLVRNHPHAKAIVQFEREGVRHTVSIVLGSLVQNKRKHGFLGVTAKIPEYPKGYLYHYRLSWWQALPAGAIETWHLITTNARMIYKLITGSISTKMLGGPISVFKAAGQATLGGLSVYLRFLAFISVTIGFVNLLPIPGLDGGHVLFQLIELVLRRPLPARAQQLGYTIGFVVLILVMIQATFNDVLALY